MRLAVVSCDAYSDAWKPFFALLDHYWMLAPKPWLVSDGPDHYKQWNDSQSAAPNFIPMFGLGDWCSVLRTFACQVNDYPILMQEDFFLTGHVDNDLIVYAQKQMKAMGAGCVRLYPCPGANEDYGDPFVGMVTKGTDYRISCQAAIWEPNYLLKILRQCKGTAADFEINGTKIAESLPEPVLAWKRKATPWPMSYLCSAISRGKWNPDAKKLCDEHGIYVDFEKRGFAQ